MILDAHSLLAASATALIIDYDCSTNFAHEEEDLVVLSLEGRTTRQLLLRLSHKISISHCSTVFVNRLVVQLVVLILWEVLKVNIFCLALTILLLLDLLRCFGINLTMFNFSCTLGLSFVSRLLLGELAFNLLQSLRVLVTVKLFEYTQVVCLLEEIRAHLVTEFITIILLLVFIVGNFLDFFFLTAN